MPTAWVPTSASSTKCCHLKLPLCRFPMPAAASFVLASSLRSSHRAVQKRMSSTSPGSSSEGKAGSERSDTDNDAGTQMHEVERDESPNDSWRILDMQTALLN
eukprot:3880073-Amphidinium_carterae.1